MAVLHRLLTATRQAAGTVAGSLLTLALVLSAGPAQALGAR